jgi:hypothetical protein
VRARERERPSHGCSQHIIKKQLKKEKQTKIMSLLYLFTFKK